MVPSNLMFILLQTILFDFLSCKSIHLNFIQTEKSYKKAYIIPYPSFNTYKNNQMKTIALNEAFSVQINPSINKRSFN